MGCYFIGIGGTGAKCVEAVSYLAAAGLMEATELCALLVDKDTTNASVGRAKTVLDSYERCGAVSDGKSNLLKTAINVANPSVWSPLERVADDVFRNVFGYDRMKAEQPSLANLFDVLYSADEKNTSLSEGFRGHPSIGAAIFADRIDLGGDEPWATLLGKIGADTSSGKEARIFLCGSVFGGTGAAGLLTIVRVIRKALGDIDRKVRFGCAMVLPYFSFEFGNEQQDQLKASSGSFVPNTQSALKYYYQNGYAECYDRIYAVGDDSMSRVEPPSLGAHSQNNPPHLIELICGLAALDFFSENLGDSRVSPVALLSRRDRKRFDWLDLPYRNREILRPRLSQFTRFAYSFLGVYAPAIREISRTPKRSYQCPWYVDFFERRGGTDVSTDSSEQLISSLSTICTNYLEWIGNIHTSSSGTEVELFDVSAFFEVSPAKTKMRNPLREPLDLDRFDTIDFQGRVRRNNGLHDLWYYLCNLAPGRDVGLEAFIRALYSGCA